MVYYWKSFSMQSLIKQKYFFLPRAWSRFYNRKTSWKNRNFWRYYEKLSISFYFKLIPRLSYCHTRLHLGFSVKLRIWQVPACKMEPQKGIIGPPPTYPQLSFFFQCCTVSPLQQSMCGVPTL